MYRKWIRFRNTLIVPKKDAMLMNPISMAIDYICYTVTNLEILLKKYSFKVIYFNINHRLGIINRSFNEQRVYDNRLSRLFKDMVRLMETSDISGIYTKYHEYFKNNCKTYSVKDIDNRIIGYDYNNDLPQMELVFIRESLIEQNRLTPDDIFYCNRLILSLLTNTRVVYTTTSNIDYLKYHKAKFIRSRNWRQYKRRESITIPQPLTHSLYQHFNQTRKLPLIDCCQTNSYDLFILTDDPYKMYIKNESTLFLDDGLLDDYIEVIEVLNEREEQTSFDANDYASFIESIEPTEITEPDIDIIIDSIIKRWRSAYSEFDLKRLKILQKTINRAESIGSIQDISLDKSTEIV